MSSLTDFNRSINYWMQALEGYDYETLCTRPSANDWSLGQVYMHLINETQYYIEQVHLCMTDREYMTGEMTDVAKGMFRQNGFPNERLTNDPAVVAKIQQPLSKEQVYDELAVLKQQMNVAGEQVLKDSCPGKTKHPGLGYFSADEWIKFADMHLRHHLRQKERVDVYLASRI